jgi:ribosomal protein S12 methylthiotransferase accessory factor
MPPERIEFDRSPRREMARLLKGGEGLPGDFHFYLHSVFPEVPVVTVIQVVPWLKRYAYNAGGGVNLDIDLAMLMGLTEFGQAEQMLGIALTAPDRTFGVGLRRLLDIPEEAPVSKIDIFFKVMAYYGYQRNVSKLDWFIKGNPTVPLSSLPTDTATTTDERFDHLVKILRKYRIDPVVFDFTPPQMRQLRLMKVYIPDLAPPYIHSKPIFGHPRYYQVPYQLGFTSAPPSSSRTF